MIEDNDAAPHSSGKGSQKPTHDIRRALRRMLLVVIYTIVWITLDRISIAVETSPGASSWYPPTALSLALLLLGGPIYVPALLIGPLLKGFWLSRMPMSPLATFGLALIHAAACGSAGVVLRNVARIDPRLRRLRDVAWFVGVALVAPLVLSLLSVADFVLSGIMNWQEYSGAVLNFWVGNAVGLICFTPALLIYGTRWNDAVSGWRRRRTAMRWQRPANLVIIEVLTQAASIVVILVIAFQMQPKLDLLAFCLCFLPLIWIATHNGLPRTAAGIVFINSGAVLVFRSQIGNTLPLVALQLFLMTLSLVGLIMGAIISERKRSAESQRFLAEASTLLTSSLDYETTFVTVARLAVPYLGDWCIVDTIGKQQSMSRVAAAHVDSARSELVEELLHRTILVPSLDVTVTQVRHTHQSCIANTVASGAESKTTGPTLSFAAAMSVPLLARGQMLGVITFASEQPGYRYDSTDLELAEDLARRAALAADNARLYREARRHLAELTTVQHVAQAINSTLRLDRLFQTIVNEIGTAFGYNLVSIYLCQDEGLVLQASIGYENMMPFIRLDKGVTGRAARTGKADFVRDVRQEPDFIVVAPNTRQAIAIPLKSGTHQVLGTLLVEATDEQELTDKDFALLTLLADQVSIAVTNARLFTELRASEQRYRTLVAQAADSILVATYDGRLIDVNEQATTLLGYTQEQLLELRILDLVAPEDEVQAQEAFEALKHNGRVFTALHLRRHDGKIFPVEINAGGMSEGIALAIVRDVSERQLLEAQLRQAQKLEAIGTLANGIAHDFNNLLAAIMGYASLILDDMAISHPQRDEMEQIVRAAHRGASLTSQLLAFSRPAAPDRRPYDLSTLVQEALRLLRPTIPSTITIIPELEEQLWKVEVDPAQFQQVVVNLAVNARDALPDGGLIQIATQNVVLDSLFCEQHLGAQPGHYAKLSVTDNGIGMDTAVLSRIFDPFFTTKEAGKGTGLGLAITHGIVRNHGGVIDVASRFGQGTSIAIYLPAIAEEITIVEDLAINAPHGHGELILVVDDEPEVRVLAQRILERYGYQTLSAENGRKAITVYREHRADVAAVLLDLTMPELDGRSTFHALRAIDQGLPVVFCSGQTLAAFGVQLSAADTAFVAKPYSIAELTRALEQVLQASKRTYAH